MTATLLALAALVTADPPKPSALGAKIEAIAATHKGKIAVGVKHLATGEEFFLRGDDPDKQPLRKRFVELLLRSRGMDDRDRDRVVFGGTLLWWRKLNGLGMRLRAVKSAETRLMKESSKSDLTLCAPPATPGRLLEPLKPATYTSPVVG